MIEEHTLGETPPNDLTLQALLYASGELDEPDAALFERRLGEDQEAREALLQAVQNNLTAMGQPAVALDPEYRDRVRQRLRQRKRLLRGQGQHSAFGPAALWCVLGAIVAVLLMLVLSHMAMHHDQSTPPSTPANNPGDDPASVPDEQSLPKLIAARASAQEKATELASRWQVAWWRCRRIPLTAPLSKPICVPGQKSWSSWTSPSRSCASRNSTTT